MNLKKQDNIIIKIALKKYLTCNIMDLQDRSIKKN